MEKKTFNNACLTIDTQERFQPQTARPGWLYQGPASDFYFVEKRQDWIGQRRSFCIHRREGLRITRRDDGFYKVTITLPPFIMAEDLLDELQKKAALAAIYFEGKEGCV